MDAEMQLGRVILFAKDMPRLAAFYRDHLGLREVATPESSDGWVVFDTGAAQLGLHEIPEPWNAGVVIDDPPEPRWGSPHKMTFRVDDVAAARDRLIAAGVTVLGSDAGGQLVRCDFLDAEGNVFQLATRDG